MSGVLTIPFELSEQQCRELKLKFYGGWPDDCPGCGKGHVEVTAFGERDPSFMPLCVCPKPSCPCCLNPLDDEGRCSTTFCPIDGHLVPLPVFPVRTDRRRPPRRPEPPISKPSPSRRTRW